jgi:hypothetical protein
MGKYRLYVASEADEDIPYIARYTEEDHILIGSDYGHNPSKEPHFVATMRARKDTPCNLIEKILCANTNEIAGLPRLKGLTREKLPIPFLPTKGGTITTRFVLLKFVIIAIISNKR